MTTHPLTHSLTRTDTWTLEFTALAEAVDLVDCSAAGVLMD